MKKFEYLVLGLQEDRFNERLNELGEDGWELVNFIVKANDNIQFVVKREQKP